MHGFQFVSPLFFVILLPYALGSLSFLWLSRRLFVRIGLQIKTFFISVYAAADGGGGGGIPQGRSVPSSLSVTTPIALKVGSKFKVILTSLNHDPSL